METSCKTIHSKLLFKITVTIQFSFNLISTGPPAKDQ